GGFGGFRGGGGFGGFGGGYHLGGFGGGGFGGGGFDRGGFGGGFDRGNFGGGGFRGDSGGFNNFRSGEGGFGRSDEGNFGNVGQRQSIGYRGNEGFDNGFRGNGNWGGDAGRFNGSVNRTQLNNFLGLPTDGGLGAASGAIGSHAFGSGQALSNTGLGQALSNRGIGSGQLSSAYGTHPFSQTWAHAQGQNVQNWANNHPNWNQWANNHNWAWSPYGWGADAWGAALWGAAAWPALGNWLGWGDIDSYPYDYGNYITYQNDNVYYGSQPAGTAQQYYDEASSLASSAPAPPNDAQWLPLGVFGLVEGDSTQPTMTFQLAVDKQGVIRGNAFAEGSTTAQPIQGAVQKKTQRVCWTVGTNTTTVYDTGLDNLTKNEASILVHTGPKFTQQQLLVRMNKPTQGGQAGDSNGAQTAN
ncbi:MAG TPA: hypothetical protein VEI07_11100, partial [Planctomycetaceae bacterium]|nr:hypothetical protein [Planctomycetaceae bacterium]